MSTPNARHAVYFVPPEGSPLERLGAAWLGRDAAGRPVDGPPLDLPISQTEMAALTAGPRHYGVHATLKPPFTLAEGTTPNGLEVAVAGLAARLPAISAPPLEVAVLGRFIALRPAAPCPALDTLGAACVTDLDKFRASQAPDELARRRSAGLTARQAALLAQWGYPYVLDAFRFHMTLTQPIDDADQRTALTEALATFFAPALGQPLRVAEIALCSQPERSAPFTLDKRFPLAGAQT